MCGSLPLCLASVCVTPESCEAADLWWAWGGWCVRAGSARDIQAGDANCGSCVEVGEAPNWDEISVEYRQLLKIKTIIQYKLYCLLLLTIKTFWGINLNLFLHMLLDNSILFKVLSHKSIHKCCCGMAHRQKNTQIKQSISALLFQHTSLATVHSHWCLISRFEHTKASDSNKQFQSLYCNATRVH